MTRRMQLGLWAALIAVTVFVAHLPSLLHGLLDGDEAIYGSIAALMNTGAPLYGSGGVDNKPPGILWVYAATFQVAGAYEMTALHFVELIAMAAASVIVVALRRQP